MPLLSVIIPSHRRKEVLFQCLLHLEQQTISNDIEVIVVDDTDEDVEKYCHHVQKDWRIHISFIALDPCHQGVARNKGIEVARGNNILFIGDDIFLAEDACERHVAFHQHQKHSVLLGFTTWDPSLEITPTMQWLEKSGWQFGYPSLNRLPYDERGVRRVPSSIQHQYSYTSHISLPTDLAKKFLFREDVTLYGWEDVEWGMRVRDAGIPLFYNESIVALHHHSMTLEDSLKRMETLGRAAKIMKEMVPAFDRVPTGWRLWMYRMLSLFPTLAGKHRKAFLKGVQK